MNSVIIRDVVTEDLERVAEIHINSWRFAYQGIVPQSFLDTMDIEQRKEGWRRRLERSQSARLRIIEQEGVIVGWHYSGASRDQDADSMTAEVYAIYLEPTCIGQGLGAALLSDAHEMLTAFGASQVTLWVLKDNQRAIQFYLRSGYQFDGTAKDIEIGEATLTEHRYRRSLEK